MKAVVRTMSNTKNCNGIELEVVALLGRLIACKVPLYGYDKDGNAQGDMVTCDFHVEKELITLKQ